MKIAINSIPLHSAHRDRGIGYYNYNLIKALSLDRDLQIEEFTNVSSLINVEAVHYTWFDFFFNTLKVKKNLPTIVTIHDVIPLIFKKHYPVGIKGKINFYLQKRALGNCKYIITDSNVSKVDIEKYLGIKKEKIVAIPLAADSEFKILSDTKLIHTKRKYNLPDRFLLYVGDANWVKNLPFLIENFKKLTDLSDFNDVKLVLVGGVFLKNVEGINHPELESLKIVNEYIKEFNIGNRVIRPGNIDKEELVAFYNLASVYVQPSLYEGFGLPVLQALSCGTPVVSSKAGSLPEVGGDACIFFDPTNSSQFQSIISEVLQNNSLQNKLSKLGLKQAAKFSWDRVAKETKAVYTKAINK